MSQHDAYGYAVARIRAMEHQLLDSSVLQRMIDAEDLETAFKILGETSYSTTLTLNSGVYDFDKLLESELKSKYSEIESFIPEKRLIDLLRYQYDFHNVKVLIKSAFNVEKGGQKRWDFLTSLGSFSVESLINDIELEEYKFLPFDLNNLLPKCIAIWEQTNNILDVERLLDDRMYQVMLETAKELDMPETLSWIRSRIDGENIRALLRLKRFNYDASNALLFMHLGGKIDVNSLVALINEPFESWKRFFEYTEYGLTINSIDAGGTFSDLILSLEKVLDDYYTHKLAASRYSYNAPENILAYLWDKEMEVKNVRMILVAKTSGGNKEQLRRLLRNV
ncbi:MAG: V-type ATPase subunit [Synergistaceae bacterium]|jgi:V/A-type H+-transporting ATPase subunit C|nr:V-type ATPase subunit [Synergistaceae bacterium]